MDRQLEKKRWGTKSIVGMVAAMVLGGAVLYALLTDLGTSKLRIDREQIRTHVVEGGLFQDFSLVTGNVMPQQSFFLTTAEGGRVEEIFLQEGSLVDRDAAILRLANTDLQLETRRQEDLLQEQENLLFNTRLQMQQERSDYGRRIAELDYRIVKQERIYKRDEALFEEELVSNLDYELSRDEYEFLVGQKELAAEEEKEKEILRKARIQQMEEATERRRSQVELANQKLAKLVVRAPAMGQLTSLDVEIGETKAAGERFGQVDTSDRFKVLASIDEHYISRVAVGQFGEFDLADVTFGVRVEKIYPEVLEGKFEIDLAFVGQVPAGITRGQTLRTRLSLGDSGEAMLLERGAFYQETGGQWVYVIDEEAGYATRRAVRLGRQNPDYFEVLDGLEAGEEVIISGYETFSAYDRIVLE